MEEIGKIILKLKANKEKLLKLLMILISIFISTLILLNKDVFANLSGYGYISIFALSVLGNSTVIIPAPVFLTAFVGGSLFNPFLVGVVSGLGASLGEMTGYMAGYGGNAFIAENARYKKIRAWVEKKGFLAIFFLAAIPNPLFDIAGISAGITKYPLKRFLVATFLGKTIKFIAVALVGAHTT